MDEHCHSGARPRTLPRLRRPVLRRGHGQPCLTRLSPDTVRRSLAGTGVTTLDTPADTPRRRFRSTDEGARYEPLDVAPGFDLHLARLRHEPLGSLGAGPRRILE